MKVPERAHELVGGVAARPREVPADVWQAHVIKHPFGLAALWGQSTRDRRWNTEGWDRVAPPVLEEGERATLTPQIVALTDGSTRCGADRLTATEYRGEPRREAMPCYECPLARRCGELTRPVGERYAGWADALLERLAPVEEVTRAALQGRLLGEVGAGVDALPSVLSIGRLGAGGAGARLQSPDGVRVELTLVGRSHLEWRTTPPLLGVLPPLPGLPLSGNALVPRRWWRGDSR